VSVRPTHTHTHTYTGVVQSREREAHTHTHTYTGVVQSREREALGGDVTANEMVAIIAACECTFFEGFLMFFEGCLRFF
jgi:hypothetical protein